MLLPPPQVKLLKRRKRKWSYSSRLTLPWVLFEVVLSGLM
jgi:hypothetical protein